MQQVREVHDDGGARRSGYALECINIKNTYNTSVYLYVLHKLIRRCMIKGTYHHPIHSSQPYATFTPGVNSDKFIL
jgi:hypothetical protein